MGGAARQHSTVAHQHVAKTATTTTTEDEDEEGMVTIEEVVLGGVVKRN